MKSLNNSLVRGLTLLFFVTAAQSVSAAAITFNTALPVAKGEFINREQVVLTRSEGDPTGLQRDMQVNSLVSVLGYGGYGFVLGDTRFNKAPGHTLLAQEINLWIGDDQCHAGKIQFHAARRQPRLLRFSVRIVRRHS